MLRHLRDTQFVILNAEYQAIAVVDIKVSQKGSRYRNPTSFVYDGPYLSFVPIMTHVQSYRTNGPFHETQ